MTTALHWFRRDLRLHDNTALHHAAATHDHVIAVFLINPTWFAAPAEMGPFQTRFWLESLAELQTSLASRGIPLIFRRSAKPLHAILELAREINAQTITLNKDYEPLQRRTDQRLEREARKHNITVHALKDAVLLEEDELLTGSGGFYSVFTPYKRAWLNMIHASPPTVVPPPRQSSGAKAPPSIDLPALPNAPLDIPTGERGAQKLLANFLKKSINTYEQTRNFPANPHSTSRLSAHLAAGTLSPRQVVTAILQHRKNLSPQSAVLSTDVFLSEIIWRDFYKMILIHRPDTVSQPFQKNYQHITWSNNPAHLQQWIEGNTGYPIIDAAQRQLRTTGFMHNRLRMISSMFLTKDLDIHWIQGERHFMQWLIDYDQAANVGGWQWSASTGTDAAPYFRVMNPTLQSQRFDPDGNFIKQMCPELAHVPAEFIHEPWTMTPEQQKAAGCIIGKDYPKPIVDHAKAKDHAIAKFRPRGKSE